MKIIPTSLGYVKQFDGLRAVAVLMVIVSHWFPNLSINKIGLGAIGVDIFFVLSGFLISRILITEKIKYENSPNNYSRLNAIKNFIIRRSLRIFPVYYLLLFLLIFFNKFLPNPIAQDWPWYFLYIQNILFYINQSWPGGKLSHLWSLAVEEQFYLIWPWVILFISQKWLFKVIVFFFFIGIASVYFLSILNKGYNFDLLTSSFLQTFSAGGILAYFHIYNKHSFSKYNKVFMFLGLLACFHFIFINFGLLESVIDSRTIISIITVGLISLILVNSEAIYLRYILGNNPIVFIGKISYGIYLFHNFIPLLLNSFLHFMAKHSLVFSLLKYNTNLYEQGDYFYIICFVILFFLAIISFFLFESPINRVKKYFNYS